VPERDFTELSQLIRASGNACDRNDQLPPPPSLSNFSGVGCGCLSESERKHSSENSHALLHEQCYNYSNL